MIAGDDQGMADSYNHLPYIERDNAKRKGREGNGNGQPDGECSSSDHRKRSHSTPTNDFITAEPMAEENANLRCLSDQASLIVREPTEDMEK
jgi:hypothetical protein